MRVDQCVSIVGAAEVTGLVCLLSTWGHVIKVGGGGLSLKYVVQMTGTLWM